MEEEGTILSPIKKKVLKYKFILEKYFISA
jgi:hypothetical protein